MPWLEGYRADVSSILVIDGGDAARTQLAEQGVGHWSAALPVVLEKHGYLDFEVVGSQALADPSTWRVPRVVLVTRMPHDAWTEDVVELAAGGRAQAVIEAPLAPAVRRRLGIEQSSELPEACTLVVRDRRLRELALALGHVPGGAIAPARTEALNIDEALLWDRAATPIQEQTAAMWRRPGWVCERWTLRRDDPPTVMAAIAPLDEPRDSSPGLVRHGSLTGICVSLFAHLGQAHTSEPVAGREWRSSRRTLGLETMLLGLIDDLLARCGRPRARVLPWPHHARWVLSVRHDVDRDPSVADIRQALARHEQVGTRATWYWRARHLRGSRAQQGADALRVAQAARGHEVALHTEQLWTDGADADLNTVNAAVGRPVRGTSAHGDASCFRYQGAPNQIWAASRRMTYSEVVQHGHMHPFRFVTLKPDGSVTALGLVGLPHHESFDVGTGDGAHRADAILARVAGYQHAGGLMQILNHPTCTPTHSSRCSLM